MQIAAHQHCEICGKVVAVDVRWCSPECEQKHEEAQQFKKKQMWKLVAILAGIIIVFQLLRLGIL